MIGAVGDSAVNGRVSRTQERYQHSRRPDGPGPGPGLGLDIDLGLDAETGPGSGLGNGSEGPL